MLMGTGRAQSEYELVKNDSYPNTNDIFKESSN